MQSDQYIPAEDIYGEMEQLEQLLDNLEQRGVELEKKLRDNPNGSLLDCRTESSQEMKISSQECGKKISASMKDQS